MSKNDRKRHGLESNPVTKSFLILLPIISFLGPEKDVGTGLDTRPCLVSMLIFHS